jgi:hypothetical protein
LRTQNSLFGEPNEKGIIGKQDGRLQVPRNLKNPTLVSAESHFTCAKANGKVLCWGDNAYGQSSIKPLVFETVSVGCHAIYKLLVREE